MRRIFALASIAYLLIYAFEGVIRYGLYNVSLSNAILLRDGLLVGPLLLLLTIQAFRYRVHPAFLAFGCIVALHGMIATLNFHTSLPAVYGAKLLVNVLFGFIAARELTQPSRRVLQLLALVWLISIIGLALDKFIYTFPWMGLETDIGGIQVDVSRGWDIEGGFEKRAAGFFRSSISAAMLLPTLAIIIAPRLRNWLVRLVFLATTVGCVALTTQKGALFAAVSVSGILLAPRMTQYLLLRIACTVFAILVAAIPLGTEGLLLSDNGGVFSFASFAMRISQTWPEAWHWISNNEIFPFGVGLGGIGGAQRFYAQNFFNPSDNLFIFLYANFGLLGVFYLAWISRLGAHLPDEVRDRAIVPLALLAFNLGYGIALSMLEDQVSALFIGAGAGMLWQLHQQHRAGLWGDAYAGAGLSLRPPIIPDFTLSNVRAVRLR